jgi:predicted phage tail protein
MTRKKAAKKATKKTKKKKPVRLTKQERAIKAIKANAEWLEDYLKQVEHKVDYYGKTHINENVADSLAKELAALRQRIGHNDAVMLQFMAWINKFRDYA